MPFEPRGTAAWHCPLPTSHLAVIALAPASTVKQPQMTSRSTALSDLSPKNEPFQTRTTQVQNAPSSQRETEWKLGAQQHKDRPAAVPKHRGMKALEPPQKQQHPEPGRSAQTTKTHQHTQSSSSPRGPFTSAFKIPSPPLHFLLMFHDLS